MISAVAARKASLAAQAAANPEPLQTTEPAAPSSSSPNVEGVHSTPHSISKSNSKRKPASQPRSGEKQKKRKLKDKRPETRYFAPLPVPLAGADAFKTQDDMIIIESDEGSSDSDIPLSSNIPADGDALSSSDSESDVPDEVPLDVTSLFPRHPGSSAEIPIPVSSQVLSTFSPLPGTNVFPLSASEIQSTLGLQPIDDLSAPGTLIALSHGETLCLLGTCILMVLHGSLTLSGATLTASKRGHRIFAPRSSPLPVLQTSSGPSKVASAHLAIPERLMHLMHGQATLVLLQELDTGVEGLGWICRTFDDVFRPSRWQKREGSTSAPFHVSGLYMVIHQTKDIVPFALPLSWSSALDAIASPGVDTNDMGYNTGIPASAPIYVVKGAKKSGKSTFARTLLNQLLNDYQRVAFLECDLGQSEFTPGGMVSLNVISEFIFGPPYTHPTLPTQAHYIGATTPRSSPGHYLDAVRALGEAYRLDVASPGDDFESEQDSSSSEGKKRIRDSIPLVINTMGWSKGLGADLTAQIEEMLGPTVIFEVELESISGNLNSDSFNHPGGAYGFQQARYEYQNEFEGAQGQRQGHRRLKAIPANALTTSYAPADHRALSILSYFHAVFPPLLPSTSSQSTLSLDQHMAHSWRTVPLCAVPPYEVDPSLALENVILTGAGSEDVVYEEIGRVLNGAIVGLVKCEPGAVEIHKEKALENGGIPYTQHQAPAPPEASNCIGLAFIRAVSSVSAGSSSATLSQRQPDASSRTLLHVLTPIPPSLLSNTRTLVKGEMELPIWGWLDSRMLGGAAGAGAEKAFNQDIEGSKIPYLQWGRSTEALGGERRRVRRNLMRRGQM